jgi:pimeloyl-ACP methyl ester carboxylesterase|tara:strand:- start:2958 stop:4001 length:1044 start_codon:yes stop_codon:yes gene_type:complete
LQQCLLELDADVSKYTQDLANEDIHEILLALGYQQVNLWGGSWGTRSALLYANQFPQQVRTAILDGNAPLENKVPLYGNADAERALQILFEDCEYDIDCQNSFTGLEQDFDEVLDAFGEAGYQVTHNDATSGKPLTVNMTRTKFVNAIRSILYSPQISRLIPIIIEQAQESDFRTLFAVLDAMQSDVSVADGAQLSVLCAEDFTRISNAEISRESNRGFVGDAFLNVFQSGCSVWPAAPLPEIYSQDLSSQVPTLILSGAIDPVTPERWGEAMAELMSNSVHLIAPNTGHNVSPFGCAPELMEQFVNEASVTNIDGSCLDELIRPSFFLDLNGPTPVPATEIDTGVR